MNDEFETEFLHYMKWEAETYWLMEGLGPDWARRAETGKKKADSLFKQFEQYKATRRAVWN